MDFELKDLYVALLKSGGRVIHVDKWPMYYEVLVNVFPHDIFIYRNHNE
jgi:hypothetical protein